ncbi:MAG: glutamine--tRNA ligase/YqeY domain fusion protein [Verrucomicrobia bacterium]|nr:MAG: glutamine--tRNA ligase/YqeY domain fusion protein [Verrucomicrobiota bacterium]
MITENSAPVNKHFVRQIIEADIAAGRNGGRVVTRFPPEPNGYLHIGHAKAICIDFGMAQEYGGRCHLRMDDTNPAKEEMEYINAIQEDVRWLGFDWGAHFYHASDYFEGMYAFAEKLIERGKAYVCAVPQDDWKDYRGVPTRPGKESPWRNRPVTESRDLFRRMKAGEFKEGELCLRAKIDMASPNIHLRDPVIYRILHAEHPHTGNKWCVYPMYDFAHPLEDAFEGVTHSLCSIEFEVHRPLYDWVIENLMSIVKSGDAAAVKWFVHDHEKYDGPQQNEFARLDLTFTVMSKRKLLELVENKLVSGWDDPRMPTLCGLRRRGYTPVAIRNFVETVGVTKFNSLTEVALLEHCIREDLNKTALRRMAVLKPLKVTIENAENLPATVAAQNNPEDPVAGTRQIPFSHELLIEAEDFMEVPPPKYFRLTPGGSVRIRNAGFLTCTRVEKDAVGAVTNVVCRWSPPTAELKVKGTIHWVSAPHAKPVTVRLYDRLFTVPEPDGQELDFKTFLNPHSLEQVTAFAEPAVAEAKRGEKFQFERVAYFVADVHDSQPGAPVFNHTVTLKDTWAKAEKAKKH